MTNLFLHYSVLISVLGMGIAGILFLFKKSVPLANGLFIFSGLLGFIGGVIYLTVYPGQEITLLTVPSFFQAGFTLQYLGAVFFTLVSGIAVLVGIYSVGYLPRYATVYHIPTVQFLTCLFVLGMQGVLLANNVIGFMFFWEVMSVASFFLVMADKTMESVRAAFLYFIMTHIGAAALLGGFLIVSGGSLVAPLNTIFTAAATLSPSLSLLAFFLFLFGFGSKAGLVPFHVWLPEAHPQAPSHISALMSGLMLKVAVYGFIMVAFHFVQIPLWATLIVILLGVLSAVFGVLYATLEKDLKRALAYSSIENMGIIFMMLGVALYFHIDGGVGDRTLGAVSALLVALALFHALNHAIFKTGLFLIAGTIISKVHSRSLEVMGGLAKIMPFFSGAFLVLALGGAALPPFGTFYGEWGFIQALVSLLGAPDLTSSTVALLVTILSVVAFVGGMAVLAMVRIFGISMLGAPRTDHVEKETAPDYRMLVPVLTLGAAILIVGVFAKQILATLSAFGVIMFATPEASTYTMSLSPLFVAGAFALLLILAYILRRLFSDVRQERQYHTWDCGQPINAGMEYTATAFSGPIRFFFRFLLHIRKQVTATPITPTNPWIQAQKFSLPIHSVWYEKLYAPVARILFWWANKVKTIQSGRVQFYLLLVFMTLVITLIIAL